MRFDEHFITNTLTGVSIYGIIPMDCSFIVDSRVSEKNSLFVALSGERVDGHDFVFEALKNGAAGAIIARDKKDTLASFPKDKVCIVVPDPLQALCALAMAWRAQFSYPVIGITGSVGKTSTKALLAVMLKTAEKNALVSHGNQNTRIGVALNLLRMRDTYDVAVFEMGINRRGEMAELARMVRPTIGVITRIGHSHMEGLGSLQDIALEKRDIFSCFDEHNIGIIDGDQPLLSHVSYPHPLIKFGSKTTNQIQARKVRMIHTQTHCVLKIYKNKYQVTLAHPHAGAVTSALAVAAVGHTLGIKDQFILHAVQKPITVHGRFERRPLRSGKGMLINDCYNANPESMKASLEAFQHIDTGADKVAVIGDMLELGINSPFWHRQIGRFLTKVPSLKKVLLVGDMVQWIEKTIPLGIHVTRVATWQQAAKTLPAMINGKETLVLVKGSHGVGLLNLVAQCT